MPHVPPAVDRAVERHRTRWGAPELVARAPGRVNLIGEHTDYNDGFTLPMALPFDTVVAMSSVGDTSHGLVEIDAVGFGEVTIDPAVDPVAEPGAVPPWALHLAGIVRVVADAGVPTGGWRAAIDTDIPTGASLSSSAALEIATISALAHRAGRVLSPIESARLGRRVENEVVGLPSGIMDQFISAGAIAGHASLMDCRALTLRPVPFPDDVVVAILDTKTRRVLAEAAYGERRASCERAAADIGVPALRDARLDDLDRVVDPVDRRRALHVVSEDTRTVAAAEAMRDGDAVRLGELMSESHASLRDDYEVSGPGLDAIVEVAVTAPGCLGARMTGGGFAGCAVALVRRASADAFAEAVIEGYDHDGHTAAVWLCEPAAGASVSPTS